MHYETLQSIRSRLSPLTGDKMLVRTLPERSDRFSAELDGISLITIFWAGVSPGRAFSISADGSIAQLTSSVVVDLRLWGMGGEGGLLPMVNEIMRRLIGFTPALSDQLVFREGEFEGYVQVSKRWVAVLRFDCTYRLELAGDPGEPPFDGSIRVREINLEDDQMVREASVRSVFGAVRVVPEHFALLEQANFIRFDAVDGQTVVRLTVLEVSRDPESDQVEVRTSASPVLSEGEPVIAFLERSDGSQLFAVSVSSVGGGGQIQGYWDEGSGVSAPILYVAKSIVFKLMD